MAQHVTDSDFTAEVLQSDRPVLVDFWAEWCPPCVAMSPTIDALADELAATVKIVKLDVDSNPATTVAYNVRSMPTLIVFRNGQPVDLKVGAGQSRAQLVKWLETVAA
ncbi:thioredoxin [Devosia albogilva]|uniref:Thioredoxin n=1 Tax=Devosia albogilva TaxID=429726 RepID=A0ABW5QKD5_9HYPH